ncbi:hypothetical protein BST85_05140 [Aureitalea marina]|uniref:M23ase beta-sheet core domain-containing protein n=2 Tax=Aureitalea marina TaxID=930804 RepID=A0A2S7KP19_9FLAO|nr:hypothetical protein BST85_05140 [Aureitalea marina]
MICLQATSQDIGLKKYIGTDSIDIAVINNLLVDIEFYITPKDSIKDSVKVIDYAIIPPKDTLFKALRLPIKMVKDTSEIYPSDYISLRGTMGNPGAEADGTLYELPFSRGKKYKVIQGFGGKFSHDSEQSKYAVDINTQVGDTITAARSGLVIRTRDQFTERGGRDFRDKANLVNILHDDGTIASYVHLDFEGVLVSLGERVETGQPIGISGYTGFTTTPHLHFVIRKAGSIAIPFYFKGYTKGPIKKNMRLKRK